jgi:CpeT protein
LKKEKLKARCGCGMHFKTKADNKYIGSVEPGKKCMIPRDGQLTYLVSEVEVTQESWISRDRGYDPDTNKQIWGSEHGQLVFKKIEDIGEMIANDWMNKKLNHER